MDVFCTKYLEEKELEMILRWSRRKPGGVRGLGELAPPSDRPMHFILFKVYRKIPIIVINTRLSWLVAIKTVSINRTARVIY